VGYLKVTELYFTGVLCPLVFGNMHSCASLLLYKHDDIETIGLYEAGLYFNKQQSGVF